MSRERIQGEFKVTNRLTRQLRLGSCATLALALMLLSSPISAAMLVNGSFEQGPAASVTLSSGSQSIEGWTVGGESVDYLGSDFAPASDGEFSLDMNGFGIGSISQSLQGLVAGVTYLISFDLAGNPDEGPALKTLMLAIDGRSQHYDFDTTGSSRSNLAWLPQTFAFTFAGTSSVLMFSGMEFPDGVDKGKGPMLDNVRVTEAPAPGALLLLLSGLLTLGVARGTSDGRLRSVAANCALPCHHVRTPGDV